MEMYEGYGLQPLLVKLMSKPGEAPVTGTVAVTARTPKAAEDIRLACKDYKEVELQQQGLMFQLTYRGTTDRAIQLVLHIDSLKWGEQKAKVKGRQ